MRFTVICPFVQRLCLTSGSCPSARVFAPRCFQASPCSDALRFAIASLHHHVKRTRTPKLFNMLGTKKKRAPAKTPAECREERRFTAR